ncbi:MAG: hypothetical protein ACRCZI_12275 [Cetobacterium sp.]
MEHYFRVPAGPMVGQPLQLSGWQLRTIVDWYALDPSAAGWWKSGKPIPWLFRRGNVRLAKKMGKSPWGGVLVAAEFCGPTVLDGFDASGEPVGRPHLAPWVQIAAVSEDQTANTYSPFHTMMSESDLPQELGIEVGVTKTAMKDRPMAKVEVVTAAAGTREGQPITFAVADELQLWTPHNGGKKLYSVLRRNVAPMGGRLMGLCNAYEPSAQSVAEAVERAAVTAGDFLIVGPQYEAELPMGPDGDLLGTLRWVYRDAPWTDPERIAKETQDDDQTLSEVQRFYGNFPSAEAGMLADKSVQVSDLELEPGAPLAVGFDGSKRWDATAVVGVHMVTGVAYLLGFWQRPPGLSRREKWEVPDRGADGVRGVSDVLDELFAGYRVARFLADPSGWRDALASWQNTWGKDVVDRMAVGSADAVDRAVDGCQTGLRSGSLLLASGDPHAALRAHVMRAKVSRRQTAGARVLLGLVKSGDGEAGADRRIDAAAALVYASAARLEALAKGWVDEEPVLPQFAVVLG